MRVGTYNYTNNGGMPMTVSLNLWGDLEIYPALYPALYRAVYCALTSILVYLISYNSMISSILNNFPLIEECYLRRRVCTI